MTSRQRPERGVREIDLDVLDPDAALELLKVLVGVERIEAEIEAAQVLCEWLGYLPYKCLNYQILRYFRKF